MRNLLIIALSSCLGIAAADAAPALTGPAPPAPTESSVYGAPTISGFLNACRADQGGCLDEVGTALMDKMDYAGTSNVCISSPDYGKAVPGWLTAHPQTANMATEDGIFLALKTLYPCG